MNTFTFSGKIDTEVVARKHPVNKKDYSKFFIQVDTFCRLECHVFGDVGYDLFTYGRPGDRIEGIAKLFSSKTGTYIQILNFNFVDKNLDELKKVKISDDIINALKERLHVDVAVNHLFCACNPSLSEKDIEDLANNIVMCMLSTKSEKAQQNIRLIDFHKFKSILTYFIDGNSKEGYHVREMYNPQRYIDVLLENEKV